MSVDADAQVQFNGSIGILVPYNQLAGARCRSSRPSVRPVHARGWERRPPLAGARVTIKAACTRRLSRRSGQNMPFPDNRVPMQMPTGQIGLRWHCSP